MLDLGLVRISKLLANSDLPWKAVHVAGTNGKGSVCAYISSMLHASHVQYGRFNSPHLLDRWDCVSFNGKAIAEAEFLMIEDSIIKRSKAESIDATEFELLTATAFEAFSRQKVDIGIVEVGLGGRLDATNVVRSPITSVITKIGLDHQSLLGDSLEKIAYQKAGIMKAGIPCFVDGTNSTKVQQTVLDYAQQIGAGRVHFVRPDSSVYDDTLWQVLSRDEYADHQQMNITLAYEATLSALNEINMEVDPKTIAAAVPKTVWPGRLQEIDLKAIVHQSRVALLDGAHNPQAAMALKQWVDRKLRSRSQPVTWLLALTVGKDVDSFLSTLISPGDNVVTTSFGPVDGMPWVQAMAANELSRSVASLGGCKKVHSVGNVQDAVKAAASVAVETPLVIAGSLYLISDVLRLVRAEESVNSEEQT